MCETYLQTFRMKRRRPIQKFQSLKLEKWNQVFAAKYFSRKRIPQIWVIRFHLIALYLVILVMNVEDKCLSLICRYTSLHLGITSFQKGSFFKIPSPRNVFTNQIFGITFHFRPFNCRLEFSYTKLKRFSYWASKEERKGQPHSL